MMTSAFRQPPILMLRRFLLVRHGESVWNQDSKFTGWTNIPLTEAGREEAACVAKTLSTHGLLPNIFFTSVMDRCIETCNIINDQMKKTVPVHTTWRLNERHYGTLEGVPRQVIRDLYGEKFTHMMRCNYSMKPPVLKDHAFSNEYNIYRNCYFEKIKNGESKENVLDRLLPYYENDILYTLSESKFPLIVTHKHTARVLMKHLLRMSDEDFEQYQLPSKKILLVELDSKLSYQKHTEIAYSC